MPIISASTRIRQMAGLGLAACAFAAQPVRAGDAPVQVQGVFCNSEDQLSQVLERIGQGVNPRLAVESANAGSVECTFADLLHYHVASPVLLDPAGSDQSLPRFRALLVGVTVGGRLRPVAPPAEVWFVSPQLGATPVAGLPV